MGQAAQVQVVQAAVVQAAVGGDQVADDPAPRDGQRRKLLEPTFEEHSHDMQMT